MESNMRSYASESVCEGHPDKMCDQISDAILDDIIANNSGKNLDSARVACETAIKCGPQGGWVVLIGEITSEHTPNYEDVVRETIANIGYSSDECGFNPQKCSVMVNISQQSPDIDKQVTAHKEVLGAGDQGMMFGYATNETPEYMPLPISLAHKLTRRLAEVRKSGEIGYLLPDGKSQVTVEYVDNRPRRVTRVVIAAHHRDGYDKDQIKSDIIAKVIQPVIPSEYLDTSFDWDKDIAVNGEGKFTTGGPEADAGMTGRKIIVDTYGGLGHHGGGAFSGKDPTKVDRSANYLARYVAKNIVAAGLADKCEFHLAYCIGKPDPFAFHVNTFGTCKKEISDTQIEEAVKNIFPLRPGDIIRVLNLRRPIYKKTAVYGHFGRNDPDFTWERVDKVEDLHQELKL
jgi:S-adenosylmethionine synthetase